MKIWNFYFGQNILTVKNLELSTNLTWPRWLFHWWIKQSQSKIANIHRLYLILFLHQKYPSFANFIYHWYLFGISYMQFLGVYIRDCLQISFLISKLLFHLTSSSWNHQKTMDQKNSVFVHFSRSALIRKVNVFVVLTAADYDIETVIWKMLHYR